MKSVKFCALWMIGVFILTLGVSHLAMANPDLEPPKVKGKGPLGENRPGAPWIKFWWMFDGPITNTGGFQVAGCKDWMKEGTGGKWTDDKLATVEGLKATKDMTVNIDKKNGGPFKWTALEINPADTHNMSTVYGLANQENIGTYAMLVVQAAKDVQASMSTAHDDHAIVWINGKQVYSNKDWTEGVNKVTYEVDVSFNKGANVILYRCEESGGDDHFNMHFDNPTNSAVKFFPSKKEDNAAFWREVQGVLPVDPKDKLATTWGEIKRPR